MKNVVVLLACFAIATACSKREETPVEFVENTAAAATAPLNAEFADLKYVEMGKKDLAALNAGNLDGYLSSFSDNARFYMSGGDSLIGKPAIAAYWKERFKVYVKSASFVNDIWTPLKVNVSQRKQDVPGVWLLSWYQTNVEYNNGQKLSYWVHADFHYDSSDKIDVAILYMDRAPIVAALARK